MAKRDVNPALEAELRRARQQAVAENSGRLAFCYADYTSTGLGQYAFPKAVMFDVGFVERPFMQYGYTYDGLEDEDDVVVWPRSTGFVWDWDQDSKGLWRSAYVGVCVDTPVAVVPTPSFSLVHHFTFSGLAIKHMPNAWLLED